MNTLPTIKDLRSDVEIKSDQNELNVLLNNEPPKEWIKLHPFVKNLKYIPIERIEYLLTRIFIRWNVEIKTVQLLANSITVTVRLHYMDVLSKEMLWQDGIGSAPLQTDQGAGAIDFNKIKSSAVMIAAPAAESYAVKDAAEKIGKLFGKDLNRADQILYSNLSGTVEKQDKYSSIFDEQTNTKTDE